MLQIALAASLASLSAAALAEEVGAQLGMLWPTRVLPALLRALPYLSLYTDRCTSLMYITCTCLVIRNACMTFWLSSSLVKLFCITTHSLCGYTSRSYLFIYSMVTAAMGGFVMHRWAVQAMPEDEVVSSAIVKVAAGTPLLAASLTPHALLSEVGPVVLCVALMQHGTVSKRLVL